MTLFELKNFSIRRDGELIVDNLNLKINKGEVHIIMGPNGAGKSTLAEGILGSPTVATSGEIILEGNHLDTKKTNERANAGIFLAFQHPEEIDGLKLIKLIWKSTGKSISDIKQLAEESNFNEKLLDKSVNSELSGGEKKRSEMFQLLAKKPKLAILDEIDSGIDIDGLKMIGDTINKLRKNGTSFLIISHNVRIYEYIHPDKVYLFKNGKISDSGGIDLAKKIELDGYNKQPN